MNLINHWKTAKWAQYICLLLANILLLSTAGYYYYNIINNINKIIVYAMGNTVHHPTLSM